METRASYLIVGAFVLALIAGAFGFGLWITRANLRDTNVIYYVNFTGSVSGLQVGSQVQLRGVPVGSVSDIAIDERNIELIQVTVAIRPGTPIKTDTVAQLQLQGITGLNIIQLSGGTQDSPPLEPALGKRRAVIPSVPSPLERVFENVPEVTAQIVELAERLNSLLNDQNRQAIADILNHLDTFTATLAGSHQDVTTLLHSLPELAASLNGLATQLSSDSHRLAGRSEEAATALSQTAKDISRMASELGNVAADNRAAVHDFSQSGLYELSQFLTDARVLVNTLNRLAEEMERDPARFLFGDQQKGVEPR
ncbi:MAG: MCE family protein [Alphaproteobacteria bacterium]|nr:MCE family protein [Alphaproteobacteria bacterium]